MRTKIFSILLIFIFALVLTTVASAGIETQLTNGERLTQRTSISGDYVFWTETTANALNALNLTTGQRISRDGHYVMSDQLSSDGNKVVWTSGDDDVYMYDISTDTETHVKSGGRFPDIYGNYVVYTNNYSYGEDHQNDGIYLYDISAHKETKVANVYSSPAIYDKQVVWSQANSNNGYDIRKYDISTHQTITVTTTQNSIPESELDIYGNIVVWIESANVYMYDISSHKKTQVTNNGNASQPAIYGNLIVYTICDRGDLYTPGDTDIYMYDISTARTTRITTSTCAFGPSIFRDKIVYADSRSYPETGEIRDIYLYELNLEKPVADFYSPEAEELAMYGMSSSNNVISFFDNSTGSPTSWLWDFGDGNASTEKNPVHAYGAIGGYTVNLTVANNAGSNTTSKYGYILINEGSGFVHPAYFSSDVRSGTVPLTVLFKDDGRAGIWKTWYFGDGSTSSISIDPFDDNGLISEYTTHTYEKPGKYTVMLWYDDRGGNGLITKYHYINVTEASKPVTAFTVNKPSDPKSLTMKFIDKSIGNPTSWFWNFGDGSNSTDKNPTHTYSTAGTFTVNLTVSNANGTDSKIAIINVLKTASSCAYISNYASNSVSVIDTATNSVIATVPVGTCPSGVAVNPEGTEAYVANTMDSTISVIDTAINNIKATVPVGLCPIGVAVNPSGTKLYVTNMADSTVSVIDTTTHKVTATVSVERPYGITVNPAGTRVYVTNFYENTVSVINTTTNTVMATVNVGKHPKGVIVNKDGTKVYVANSDSDSSTNYTGTISVIDTATNNITATVPVGHNPWGIALSPDGTKIYVANYESNTLSVIDTATNAITDTISAGNNPFGVAFSLDGTKAYVANAGSYDTIGDTITLIDTETNLVSGEVKVGIHPIAFGLFTGAFQAFKPALIVANFSSNVTNGSAPLSVQFTDRSVNATQWYWEFGDGYTSTEQNPNHEFKAPGNYTVNLTVSNSNGTSYKTKIVTLLDVNSSEISSDGDGYGDSSEGNSETDAVDDDSSSSSNGGSGGGSAVGSPELQKNVEIKELSQIFISSGQPVKFEFPQKVTVVESISFDSKKTVGKTTTIVEMLKNQSTLVSGKPSDEVYKYLNIWVGSSGYATSKNIENAVVCFKVGKSWIKNNKIDKSSITLNRYNNKTWSQLPTSLMREENDYLVFTAQTPGFSPFAITGKTTANTIGTLPAVEKTQPSVNNTPTKLNKGNETANLEQKLEKMNNSNISGKQSTRAPGFEIASCIVCLLFLYSYRKR